MGKAAEDYSTSEGTIVSIGPGPRDDNGILRSEIMEGLNLNQIVVFSKYSGRILHETTAIKYILLNEKEILAVKKE